MLLVPLTGGYRSLLWSTKWQEREDLDFYPWQASRKMHAYCGGSNIASEELYFAVRDLDVALIKIIILSHIFNILSSGEDSGVVQGVSILIRVIMAFTGNAWRA